MITFDGVSVSAEDPGNQRILLHPLTLALPEQRICVIGANGSGKSTLLKLINGLVRPDTGSVRVHGLDTVKSGRQVRRKVGFVFTDPLAQLVMPTGREDIELSLRAQYRDSDRRRAAADAVLARFNLDGLADQSIFDLSGGERQLMALATVLAVEPNILVADEPTTLLDLRNEILVRALFQTLEQQIVYTTHNLAFALESDRTLVIDDGKLVYDGTPADAVVLYRDLCRRTSGSPRGLP